MGRHNDKNIKDVLKEFIGSNDRVARGYNSSRIDEVWRSQMGEMISKYTRKIYFSDHTLKVYLTSAPLKKELLMGKDKVINIINEAMGENIIKHLEVY